ncbi:MAG: hypothetical protein MUC57_19995, partial [Desulfobacterales bacterium]|nr:hypothetical protein [Desulfobacterales bacterium]
TLIRNMMIPFVVVAAGLFASGLYSPASAGAGHGLQPLAVADQKAPRLQNLGRHTFPVTTASPDAQRFINQGLILAYGFNHAEAARSFGEAARLDPGCAMAYWGMALVGGPNINMEMAAEAGPAAYKLVQRAMALRKGASEREQAFIEALSRRYSAEAHARIWMRPPCTRKR